MPCEICDKQPRKKHAEPLPCMIPDPNKKPVSARFHGRGTDDTYYLCQECGHDWLHETGPDGFGWID